MKKLIALIMVAAMVMSMGVVAFAATDAPAVLGAYDGYYKYNSDKDLMEEIPQVQYGNAFYLILMDVDSNPVVDFDSVSGMKIKAKWEMGADLVDSISLVKKLESGLYLYAIEIKTKASTAIAEADLVGTLTITKTKVPKIAKDTKLPVEITVFWDKNYSGVYKDSDGTEVPMYMVDGVVDDSEILLAPDTNYLLKFDYDDEVDFEFGSRNGGKNEGVFTVDVSGQGKLLVKFDTKANADIDAANPAAITKYVNFNGVTFNRSGSLFLESPEGAYEYIYAIVNGKLAAIPTAEYDDYDEGFYVKTRTLGAYVLSDIELVNPVEEAEVTDVTAVPVVNPDTGAAA